MLTVILIQNALDHHCGSLSFVLQVVQSHLCGNLSFVEICASLRFDSLMLVSPVGTGKLQSREGCGGDGGFVGDGAK